MGALRGADVAELEGTAAANGSCKSDGRVGASAGRLESWASLSEGVKDPEGCNGGGLTGP